MYATLRDRPRSDPEGPAPPGRRAGRLRAAAAPTVLALGLTSLLTDLSTEMVNAVLPLYLVTALGFTAFQYGLVNGLYTGSTAVVRLLGGYWSDRWGRHRDVAAIGYALSALARGGLVFGGPSAGAVSTSLAADRLGKGIRTAPRDAMLAAAARPADLGLVFGVHRAMDTAGAMLGPFAAFALLAVARDAYDLVFVVSACVAVTAVAGLVLLVDGRAGARLAGPAGPAPAGAVPAVAAPGRVSLAPLRERRFATLVAAGFALSLVTVGDGFVYLRMRDTSRIATAYFPLLAAGTAAVYLVLAVPLGRLADRVGRRRILLAGYLSLLALYLVLLLPRPGPAGLVGCLALLGAFYACTDGVLAAVASGVLPAATRTSGLALLATAGALGQLAASVAFGLLWTAGGSVLALLVTIGATAAAIMVAAVTLRLGQPGRLEPVGVARA